LEIEAPWEEIDQILQEVLALPEEEHGPALDTLCRGRPQVRREVEAFLEADRKADAFLSGWAGLPNPIGASLPNPIGRTSSQPILGPYRLLREVGRGGMGTVFLAERCDGEYQQKVAIKVAHLALVAEELRRRFVRERQILAQLEHPGIARLLDGGTTADGIPYLVIEYVEGVSITEFCRREELTLKTRLELFEQVLEAVIYAHRNLVVHRDLKPSNILVTSEGQTKLLDFGIAKLLAPGFEDDPTLTEDRLATPRYASPEQLTGAASTTASDVYTLGILLYQLLTGRRPWEISVRNPGDLQRLLEAVPRPPSEVVRGEGPKPEGLLSAKKRKDLAREFTGDLDAIVLKALRKDPKDRYGSVEDFLEDLQLYHQGQAVTALRGSRRYRARKFLRRNRVRIAVSAAFAMILMLSFLDTIRQARQIARERDIAQEERLEADVERRRAEQVTQLLVEVFGASQPEQARGEIPSARTLLDRGRERLQGELSDQPQLRATLKRTIGIAYRNLGLWQEAEPLLRSALATHRRLSGESHSETVRSLSQLGILLHAQGRYEEAESLHREALQTMKAQAPWPKAEHAASLENLGTVLRESGAYDEAVTAQTSAIRLFREIWGPRHERTFSAQGGLAEIYRRRGQLPEAEALLRQALRDFRGDDPLDHPGSLEMQSNLALVLDLQSQFQEAVSLLEEVVREGRRILGPRHPTFARYLGNLAGAMVKAGRPAEAEPVAREALALKVELASPGLELSLTELTIGHAVRLQSRFEEAESNYRRGLELCLEAVGPDHPHCAHPLLWMGRTKLDAGEPMKAAQYFRQAADRWRESLPQGHFLTTRAEGGYGASLAAQGRWEEALPLLRLGYESALLHEGAEAGVCRWLKAHLLALYEATGREEAALELRRS